MVSFGNKAQQEALDALVVAVGGVLRPIGFEQASTWDWRRNLTWRIDEVDLVVKGGTSKHLLPSFRVLLPRTEMSQSGDKHQHIAQVNVARLLRPHAGPEFDEVVPSLSLGRGKFVRTVISDINAALSWFEQFATPEECMANLGKFLKFGCPAYVDAEKFLSSLTHD
jgi:hypothetical protein